MKQIASRTFVYSRQDYDPPPGQKDHYFQHNEEQNKHPWEVNLKSSAE